LLKSNKNKGMEPANSPGPGNQKIRRERFAKSRAELKKGTTRGGDDPELNLPQEERAKGGD